MRTKARAIARALLGRGLLLAAASLAFHCQSARQEPTDGETHFLKRCATDGACGGELVCACGVCTLPCSEATTCGRFPGADCASPPAACELPSVGLCDVACTVGADCVELSPSHRCVGGVCRSTEAPLSACAQGDVSANEVVLVGDAFFAESHSITAFLEDLARQSGALLPGERYRDYSSLIDNTLALAGNGIEAMYTAAQLESSVKVVIMTGGGADVLLGSCEVVAPDCPVFVAAADAASALFLRMAEDGVENVVYAFYPDPSDPMLREAVDTLRPLLMSACNDSPVPCHWVDLRTEFAGKSNYLDATGTRPTLEGAQVSATAVWNVMQAQCIAQAP